MTTAPDLVTVPRSLIEKVRNRIHVLGVIHPDYRHFEVNEKIYLPELDAALASSDPEGGARGVQESIATKQATDLTSDSVTELNGSYCKFCGSWSAPLDDANCATAKEALERTASRPYGCPWLDAEGKRALAATKQDFSLEGGARGERAAISNDRCKLDDDPAPVASVTQVCSCSDTCAADGFTSVSKPAPQYDALGRRMESVAMPDAQKDALARCYGRLWLVHTDDKSIHLARRELLSWLTKDEQAWGIEHAKAEALAWPSRVGPSDPLTKTPSADHDDGNLRGLAEQTESHGDGYFGLARERGYIVPSAPNHQPHAVSQGWRTDIENARPLSEWSEDLGDVLWWTFPITEPPYIGSPLSLGYTVEAEMILRRHGEEEVSKIVREQVGGWPGYHTHFTPIPLPAPPSPAKTDSTPSSVEER